MSRKVWLVVLVFLLIPLNVSCSEQISINNYEQELKNRELQIANLQRQIEDKDRKIQELEQQIRELQPQSTEVEPSPAGEDVINITAIDLHNEAEANAIAAERKYRGKIIKVTGELEAVERYSDFVRVSLMAEGFGGRIWCNSSGETWENQVVALVKGRMVTIKGEWDSWYLGVVSLKNCSVAR